MSMTSVILTYNDVPVIMAQWKSWKATEISSFFNQVWKRIKHRFVKWQGYLNPCERFWLPTFGMPRIDQPKCFTRFEILSIPVYLTEPCKIFLNSIEVEMKTEFHQRQESFSSSAFKYFLFVLNIAILNFASLNVYVYLVYYKHRIRFHWR